MILTHFLEKVEQRIKGKERSLRPHKAIHHGTPYFIDGQVHDPLQGVRSEVKTYFFSLIAEFQCGFHILMSSRGVDRCSTWLLRDLRDTLWWEIPRLTPAAHTLKGLEGNRRNRHFYIIRCIPRYSTTQATTQWSVSLTVENPKRPAGVGDTLYKFQVWQHA